MAREARDDIAEAVAWLRGRSAGLPHRFRAELETIYALRDHGAPQAMELLQRIA